MKTLYEIGLNGTYQPSGSYKMTRKDSDYSPEEPQTPFFWKATHSDTDPAAMGITALLVVGSLVLIGVILWALITLL